MSAHIPEYVLIFAGAFAAFVIAFAAVALVVIGQRIAWTLEYLADEFATPPPDLTEVATVPTGDLDLTLALPGSAPGTEAVLLEQEYDRIFDPALSIDDSNLLAFELVCRLSGRTEYDDELGTHRKPTE